MPHVIGEERNQLIMLSLESTVPADAFVRVIDAYVDATDLRTSRKLEREARLNMEAMWLTSCQSPRYKTIADFRKNHAKAFRQVFRSFVLLLIE